MLGLIVILLVIVLFVCILVWANSGYNYEGLEFFSIFMIVLAGIALLFCLINVAVERSNPDAKLATMNNTYESLVYQLENRVYESDNNIGMRELYERIEQYNNDVISGRYWQNNIWWGFMWPKIYDKMALIDYNAIGGGG